MGEAIPNESEGQKHLVGDRWPVCHAAAAADRGLAEGKVPRR